MRPARSDADGHVVRLAAALELVIAPGADPHLAAAACRDALTTTGNEAERVFLTDRIAESVAGSGTMGTSPNPPQENS